MCGHHVLDIDEGVFAAVSLQDLERLLDEVTQVLSLVLTVVNLVPRVAWQHNHVAHIGMNNASQSSRSFRSLSNGN